MSFITDILLGALVIIEFLNLCVRVVKIIPQEDPPISDDIRIKMYS